jgi:hypothetical protein
MPCGKHVGDINRKEKTNAPRLRARKQPASEGNWIDHRGFCADDCPGPHDTKPIPKVCAADVFAGKPGGSARTRLLCEFDSAGFVTGKIERIAILQMASDVFLVDKAS